MRYRQRRLGAYVAEAEHRRAIGDHRHGVLLHRQGERPAGILLDGQADAGHARGVDHREVIPGADRYLAPDLDLPAQVHEEGAVRGVDDPYPSQMLETIDNLLTMDAVARVDRDVPQDAVSGGLHQVDGADVAAGGADRHRDATQHPGTVGDRQSNRNAVRGARCDGHYRGTSRRIRQFWRGVLLSRRGRGPRTT